MNGNKKVNSHLGTIYTYCKMERPLIMEKELDYRLLEKTVYDRVDETTEMMQKLLDSHSYDFIHQFMMNYVTGILVNYFGSIETSSHESLKKMLITKIRFIEKQVLKILDNANRASLSTDSFIVNEQNLTRH